MKQIIVKNLTNTWSSHSFSFIEYNKEKETYTTLCPFASCRSWMCDTLFTLKNKKWKGDAPTYPFTFDYTKGNIYIGVLFSTKEQKETFIRNISNLQSKEKQAKVRICKVYGTQNSLALVIKGSKYWKDSCWKMMLYTFYIKTFAYKDPKSVDMSYWKALSNGKEDKLLSHVRMKPSSEIFDDSVYKEQRSGMHFYEGFVSICTGKNPPMAKLLGVE